MNDGPVSQGKGDNGIDIQDWKIFQFLISY